MRPIHANELLAGLALARPVLINAVVTDSRRVQPGCVFVCFPGARVDGHDFAAAAYRAGAEYIIANHPVEGVPEDHLVVTPSSHRAMLRMASNYRTLFNPLMIGVTGSVGKTTTKEFCYAVLSAFGNTLKTETVERCVDRPAQHAVPPGRSDRIRRRRDGNERAGGDRPPGANGPPGRRYHHDDRRLASGKSRQP